MGAGAVPGRAGFAFHRRPFVGGREARPVPAVVRGPYRYLRVAVAERNDWSGGLVACGSRSLVEGLESSPRVLTADQSSTGRAFGGPFDGRALSPPTWRYLPSPGLRFRRHDVGARRARVSRRLRRRWRARRVGTLPLRQRRPCLDLLHRGCARFDGAIVGCGAVARGDDRTRRAGLGELRPVLPGTGLHAKRVVRESDRLTAPG